MLPTRSRPVDRRPSPILPMAPPPAAVSNPLSRGTHHTRHAASPTPQGTAAGGTVAGAGAASAHTATAQVIVTTVRSIEERFARALLAVPPRAEGEDAAALTASAALVPFGAHRFGGCHGTTSSPLDGGSQCADVREGSWDAVARRCATSTAGPPPAVVSHCIGLFPVELLTDYVGGEWTRGLGEGDDQPSRMDTLVRGTLSQLAASVAFVTNTIICRCIARHIATQISAAQMLLALCERILRVRRGTADGAALVPLAETLRRHVRALHVLRAQFPEPSDGTLAEAAGVKEQLSHVLLRVLTARGEDGRRLPHVLAHTTFSSDHGTGGRLLDDVATFCGLFEEMLGPARPSQIAVVDTAKFVPPATPATPATAEQWHAVLEQCQGGALHGLPATAVLAPGLPFDARLLITPLPTSSVHLADAEAQAVGAAVLAERAEQLLTAEGSPPAVLESTRRFEDTHSSSAIRVFDLDTESAGILSSSQFGASTSPPITPREKPPHDTTVSVVEWQLAVLLLSAASSKAVPPDLLQSVLSAVRKATATYSAGLLRHLKIHQAGPAAAASEPDMFLVVSLSQLQNLVRLAMRISSQFNNSHVLFRGLRVTAQPTGLVPIAYRGAHIASRFRRGLLLGLSPAPSTAPNTVPPTRGLVTALVAVAVPLLCVVALAALVLAQPRSAQTADQTDSTVVRVVVLAVVALAVIGTLFLAGIMVINAAHAASVLSSVREQAALSALALLAPVRLAVPTAAMALRLQLMGGGRLVPAGPPDNATLAACKLPPLLLQNGSSPQYNALLLSAFHATGGGGRSTGHAGSGKVFDPQFSLDQPSQQQRDAAGTFTSRINLQALLAALHQSALSEAFEGPRGARASLRPPVKRTARRRVSSRHSTGSSELPPHAATGRADESDSDVSEGSALTQQLLGSVSAVRARVAYTPTASDLAPSIVPTAFSMMSAPGASVMRSSGALLFPVRDGLLAARAHSPAVVASVPVGAGAGAFGVDVMSQASASSRPRMKSTDYITLASYTDAPFLPNAPPHHSGQQGPQASGFTFPSSLSLGTLSLGDMRSFQGGGTNSSNPHGHAQLPPKRVRATDSRRPSIPPSEIRVRLSAVHQHLVMIGVRRWRVVFWSRAACDITGLAESQVKGVHLSQLVADGPTSIQKIEHLFRNRNSVSPDGIPLAGRILLLSQKYGTVALRCSVAVARVHETVGGRQRRATAALIVGTVLDETDLNAIQYLFLVQRTLQSTLVRKAMLESAAVAARAAATVTAALQVVATGTQRSEEGLAHFSERMGTAHSARSHGLHVSGVLARWWAQHSPVPATLPSAVGLLTAPPRPRFGRPTSRPSDLLQGSVRTLATFSRHHTWADLCARCATIKEWICTRPEEFLEPVFYSCPDLTVVVDPSVGAESTQAIYCQRDALTRMLCKLVPAMLTAYGGGPLRTSLVMHMVQQDLASEGRPRRDSGDTGSLLTRASDADVVSLPLIDEAEGNLGAAAQHVMASLADITADVEDDGGGNDGPTGLASTHRQAIVGASTCVLTMRFEIPPGSSFCWESAPDALRQEVRACGFVVHDTTSQQAPREWADFVLEDTATAATAAVDTALHALGGQPQDGGRESEGGEMSSSKLLSATSASISPSVGPSLHGLAPRAEFEIAVPMSLLPFHGVLEMSASGAHADPLALTIAVLQPDALLLHFYRHVLHTMKHHVVMAPPQEASIEDFAREVERRRPDVVLVSDAVVGDRRPQRQSAAYFLSLAKRVEATLVWAVDLAAPNADVVRAPRGAEALSSVARLNALLSQNIFGGGGEAPGAATTGPPPGTAAAGPNPSGDGSWLVGHRLQGVLEGSPAWTALLTAMQDKLEARQVLQQRRDYYRRIAVVGRGACGEVWKVRDGATRGVLALKIIPLPPDHAAAAVAEVVREVKVLSRLEHRNIVKYIGARRGVPDADGAAGDHQNDDAAISIIMEYCGSSVEKLIEGARAAGDMPERMPLCFVVHLIRQLLAALVFVHERGIIHRDIKPANVLLAMDDEQAFSPTAPIGAHSITSRAAELSACVKLSDFGSATPGAIRAAKPTDGGPTGGLTGTLRYMAPEALQRGTHTAVSDIWSVGLTLLEMLGVVPNEINTCRHLSDFFNLYAKYGGARPTRAHSVCPFFPSLARAVVELTDHHLHSVVGRSAALATRLREATVGRLRSDGAVVFSSRIADLCTSAVRTWPPSDAQSVALVLADPTAIMREARAHVAFDLLLFVEASLALQPADRAQSATDLLLHPLLRNPVLAAWWEHHVTVEGRSSESVQRLLADSWRTGTVLHASAAGYSSRPSSSAANMPLRVLSASASPRALPPMVAVGDTSGSWTADEASDSGQLTAASSDAGSEELSDEDEEEPDDGSPADQGGVFDEIPDHVALQSTQIIGFDDDEEDDASPS